MKKFLFFGILLQSGTCFSQNFLDQYLTGTPGYTTIASSAQSINEPRDLDFKPYTNELWVANKGGSNGSPVIILYNAGQSGQRAELRHDSHAGHFIIYASAIAFGDNGDWGSTGEIKNTANPASTFMGPALWSSDTSMFARVFQNNWVNGKPLGSHLDMLHQSPFSMGIAHDSANSYWVFDGHNGNLCRYDFGTDHSAGYDDHSNGKIWRYTDVPLTRQPNVPGHMVLDKSTGWLYIVDAGTKKIKRVNTKSGSVSGTLSVPVTGAEALAGYWSVTGAQVQVLDSFLSSQPSGIDLYNGRLVVGDYGTGNIHIYNISGSTPAKLGTIATGQSGVMGLKIGPDGRIWFVNHNQNTVVRINPAALPNNDASIDQITGPLLNNAKAEFYHPGFNQCGNSISPVVVLKNAGANALTAATINYRIDNGPSSSFSWTGSIASGATASVTLPPISFGNGGHELIVSVVNPNGSPDSNPANDRKEGSFRGQTTVANYPFSEGFTAASFPPVGWTYIGHNFNNEMSHAPAIGAFGTNSGSIRMDHYSNPEDISGQKDYLVLPRINMSSAGSSAGLGFSVAYAQYDASSNDELAVMASTDCGRTWTQLYTKAGAALATKPPTQLDFAPVNTEWRKEMVPLSAYAGQTNLMLMFVTTSNHGNNLYVDDVNIAAGLSVPGFQADQLSIYPNPTTGKLTLELKPGAQPLSIEVFDALGRQVKAIQRANSFGTVELDLSGEANGIYLIRVRSGDASFFQKVSLVK